ncbi:DUF4167 domain-containing protein [uncultured Cohaesibacter sp.]|uniref:DUF4167 domain-containing protein n=1 Tax=uncultured Cohaesibacter sp. TaxID=1002546 RepID=UPI00293041BC|nr:DUF4167 domain-containing protein [uncultured Cohaesibacter sp.]
MRQSQKSSRTRSRGRKPSNPLSRSYDSNGPDVKIRGTASHIAEKYQSLARDALASGDIVMAENYYQHAEHYLRIIASAQSSSRDDARQANGSGDQPSVERSNRKPSNVTEISGDEPQAEVSGFENTAMEMDVAVVDGLSDDDDASSESSSPSEASSGDGDDEGKAPAAPRRRRRTTYRSRKRPAPQDGGEGAPQPDVSAMPEAAAAAGDD